MLGIGACACAGGAGVSALRKLANGFGDGTVKKVLSTQPVGGVIVPPCRCGCRRVTASVGRPTQGLACLASWRGSPRQCSERGRRYDRCVLAVRRSSTAA